MIQDQLTSGIAIMAFPADVSFRQDDADRPAHLVRDARTIRGHVDMTGCDTIRAFFDRCDRSIRNGDSSLVIDLGRVLQADTKLMACLVAIFQIARAAAVRIELRASQAVLARIEFCKLHWLVE